MTERFLTMHTCDTCGAQVTTANISGAPEGWLTLQYHYDPEADRPPREADFCTLACLQESATAWVARVAVEPDDDS